MKHIPKVQFDMTKQVLNDVEKMKKEKLLEESIIEKNDELKHLIEHFNGMDIEDFKSE
ncbi:hypothetical protein [Anaerorhabdus furcosa]|uniref:Uncharacterized protein n=1 Tax=Anaerorhabdus furcosa TaxID=118967 RepID=A0A1T4N2K0_9FIRM|nr:hypothetical protein [Anaerorhabdus furcosa]SJZ73600.1 hypothetical protein SAMN02745191_1461 [Anaerorhabdus furcosa]